MAETTQSLKTSQGLHRLLYGPGILTRALKSVSRLKHSDATAVVVEPQAGQTITSGGSDGPRVDLGGSIYMHKSSPVMTSGIDHIQWAESGLADIEKG